MATVLANGHSESVMCCTTTKDGRVISGAEQGEICLWSPDEQSYTRTVLESKEDVTSMCCANRTQHKMFASAGEEVFEFDLRKLDHPVHRFQVNEDEVNQIAVNSKDDFLAACDDSGEIKVIKLQDKSLFKTLRRHDNICASLCFRSRRPWDILSVGYDKQLIQWDFSRARVLCKIDMDSLGKIASEDDVYVVNPPFIHTMSTSATENHMACGTDNALVQVFDTSKRTPEFLGTLRGHTQGVSQVHFPKFEETCLLSGGNDGSCIVWNIEDISQIVSNGHSTSSSSAAADNAAASDLAKHMKYKINHGEKINWLTTGQTTNRKFIVIADNRQFLTSYPFPAN